MSADLFAEFNTPSPPPPSQHPWQPPKQPQQQQQQQQQQNFFKAQPQPLNHLKNETGAKDPFDFFNKSNEPAKVSQPTSAWPSFQTQPVSSDIWGNPTPVIQPSNFGQESTEDDDGWGDFEEAESNEQKPTLQPGVSAQATTGISSSIPWPGSVPSPVPQVTSLKSQEFPPRTRIIRASTLDLMSNNLVDIGHSISNQPTRSNQSSQIPWGQPTIQQPNPQPRPKSTPSDPNVLFDAEDFELQGEDIEEEDDEFGDFETVTPAAAPPKPATVKVPASLPSMDLLSLDDPTPTTVQSTQKQPKQPSQFSETLSFGSMTRNYPQAPKSPSFQDRNPFPDMAIKISAATQTQRQESNTKPSPVTAWPTFDDIVETRESKPKTVKTTTKTTKTIRPTKKADDDWGAWDEFPVEDKKTSNINAAKSPESWDWDSVDNVQEPKPSQANESPPPINVPPPSIILSIFPDLLNSGSSLFKPISGQSTSIKQRILSNPKATDFLQGYILLAETAARVIAGRKQRWHRDKILAKSMSISAAGSKGMKLAGIDKTQSVREDREAADVVAVWAQQVGRLRSAVAVSNSAGKTTLKVPELSENMRIQTAKQVPTSPKSCIICGLKREERVANVDHDVEDSFGEWWADHWGHKACKNFWIEHEQSLRQR